MKAHQVKCNQIKTNIFFQVNFGPLRASGSGAVACFTWLADIYNAQLLVDYRQVYIIPSGPGSRWRFSKESFPRPHYNGDHFGPI